MSNNEQYWGRQMALFPGGYQHVMVEMTLHLHGNGDTVPVGVVVKDHATGEWVGALVPSFALNLREPVEAAAQLIEFLRGLHEHMAPF